MELPEGKAVDLKTIGCVGRLTSYQETDDNRYGIVLTGISRFRLVEEQQTDDPFRTWRVSYDASRRLHERRWRGERRS